MRTIHARRIFIGREKSSGLVYAVTNYRLLALNSGLRPGTIRRLFGGKSLRNYYEDDKVEITVIETRDIETGGQIPPSGGKKFK